MAFSPASHDHFASEESPRFFKTLFSGSRLGKLLLTSRNQSRKDVSASAAEQPAAAAAAVAKPHQPQPAQAASQQNSSDLYVLKRDYLGSCRLNLQYYLWKETLGFTLHPSIDIESLGASPRIADVATGTGIWLIETRNLFPKDAQCKGFDIDLSQAPHPEWLPSNVSLTQWDMFSEVPDALVGQFDVVHIRLVLLVIKNNDPVPLINNLLRLLKPGGYLQWDEVSQMDKSIVKVSESVTGDAINAMFRVDIPDGVKGSDNWQRHLPATMKSQGFQSATEYTYIPPPALARYWHDMYTLAWDEMLTNVLGLRAPQALIVAEQGMNEVRNGAAISMPIIVWVARKL